jgi:hypothetical protein
MDLALFDKTQLGSMSDDKPARLTIKEFVNAKLFITNLTGGVKPNFQLMYSLGDDVFLNTFSERLSMWELRGLHILTDCAGADVPGEPPFLTFYKQYNIKTEQTVSMSFAGITMKGYLVDLQIKDYNQNGVEGFAFVLQYLALLQNLDSADAATAATAATAAGATTPGEQSASDFGLQVLRSAGFELLKSDSALPLRSSNLPRLRL